ncbi:MAG: hypothetical protein U0K23_07580 [Selenomonadaceae bacterium]|nr:hypothetical protein [Selenomonadaceae bacterium]
MKNNVNFEWDSLIRSTYWGQIYNSTILDSEWLINKSISPGRWAVGYEFLYVLYRVLDEVKPNSILELGLGQSSKLTTQYAIKDGVQHDIVEHDMEWVSFFTSSWKYFSNNTLVNVCPLKEAVHNNQKYLRYDNFDKVVDEKKYNLIIVDGPFGGDFEASRRDILSHIPDILDKDFVVLFDDCGRPGERNTVQDFINMLNNIGIENYNGVYNGGGIKITIAVTSKSWKWLTSL